MVFTAAQKRAWRKRPEVKARRRRERNSRAKRISNGQSPHGKRPSELRLPAIMVMGGKCQDCGNDHHAVLNFIHTKPVQRRTNALSKNYDQGVRLYRRILRGQRTGVELLCANCAIIRRTLIADIATAMARAKRAMATMHPSRPASAEANAPVPTWSALDGVAHRGPAIT